MENRVKLPCSSIISSRIQVLSFSSIVHFIWRLIPLIVVDWVPVAIKVGCFLIFVNRRDQTLLPQTPNKHLSWLSLSYAISAPVIIIGKCFMWIGLSLGILITGKRDGILTIGLGQRSENYRCRPNPACQMFGGSFIKTQSSSTYCLWLLLLQRQNSTAPTKTMKPPKPLLFASWSFRENVCPALVYFNMGLLWTCV